jgi:hypothetical protein
MLDPTSAAAATEGPSFGDLLADQAPSTLAPLPSTSTSSTGKPTPLSLSRLLTQALHSADSPLLNSCLSHSDPTLVSHTVRRLQPELTVPLLERLAERLALGGKGRQGGASAQRVRAVCVWLKVTLRERLAFLATIPGLVSRLEPLHRLIADRLALTAPLMGLAGRLELALAQLELRAAAEGAEAAEGEAPRYVEGESDDESESDDDDEDEVALEEGEVEDVGLGGESDDEDDEDASEGEDEYVPLSPQSSLRRSAAQGDPADELLFCFLQRVRRRVGCLRGRDRAEWFRRRRCVRRRRQRGRRRGRPLRLRVGPIWTGLLIEDASSRVEAAEPQAAIIRFPSRVRRIANSWEPLRCH